MKCSHWLTLFSAILLASCSSPPRLILDAPADAALRKMSDRLGKAQALRLVARRQIDRALIPHGVALADSEVELIVQRPGRAKATVRDASTTRTFWLNDGTFTVHDTRSRLTTTQRVPGTIDGTIATLSDEFGIYLPIAEFVASSPYKVLTAHSGKGSLTGVENIRGAPCDKIEGGGGDVMWTLWIHQKTSLPSRLVVNYLGGEKTGSLTVDFLRVETHDSSPFSEPTFTAAVPANAIQVDIIPAD